MKSAVLLLVATAILFPLVGCGGDDPVAETEKPVADLRKWADGLLSGGDDNTIDAVLSLGFLTPETVSVFLSYMPYLEDSINRLADLLLAVRLGLKLLNENSLRTALFSTEETVNGLKLLSQS